jgi:ATP-dependent DNA helicase RecG
MPPTQVPPLETPLTRLWGVGAERSGQLTRLGLHTVGDLLLLRPRRYEDRRHFLSIAELQLGQAATTRGRIVAQGLKTFRKGSRSIFEFILEDGTGRLHCRWWNLPFMERYFAVGDEVMVFGKPVSIKPRTLDHPETEVTEEGDEISIHLDRVVPVYPLTEGLPQRWLRSLLWRTVLEYGQHLLEPCPELTPLITSAGGVGPSGVQTSRSQSDGAGEQMQVEATPPGTVASPAVEGLPSRAQAVRWLHFPDELAQTELARRRLALDELIALQREIQGRRHNLQAKAQGLPCAGNNRLIKPFLSRLGFVLTQAQTAVLREIRQDMGGRYPMRRLLQGEVGSGKTVVAASAALMALESGYNVALMAPTEILAEQHFQNFIRWFEPLGLEVGLQTSHARMGGTAAPLPGRPEGGQAGRPTLVIGTHALIEQGFAVPHLGLVVIDEQHKFGVAQREALLRKGHYPHLLVMTATPIPRTLGLTLYGDLDISVIRQPPAGRGRVRTYVRGPDQLPKVYDFIRRKIAEGRQTYVVYPRVEDSDLKTGLKAVKQEFERLEKEFAPHRVALLHGRVRPEDKEAVMTAFCANEVKVLLATSVIEVGVDVPNASVMLIENAEQFGLAQLHQLRGRIGRGAHDSYCVLVVNRDTPGARQRLRILEKTSDGFQIAEADLALRGPGEFLGQEQSGLPPFRFASLAQDRDLVEQARALVGRLRPGTR